LICVSDIQNSAGEGNRAPVTRPVTVVSRYHSAISAATVARPIHPLRPIIGFALPRRRFMKALSSKLTEHRTRVNTKL
jgi:hypothetical protein